MKGQLKNTEKLLVDKIEPELYQTIKNVILREEKHQIQLMKKDTAGCTDKCRLKNKMVECDLERHK